MKKLLLLFILIFAVQISAQQRTGGSKNRPPISAAKSVTAKITQFLEKESGYTKVSENVWTIPYEGKSLARFNVIVTTDPDSKFVVMLVVIAKKKDLRLSQDLLYTILKYNDLADQVKAGIDQDGDLFLRAEISGRLIDLQEFRSVVEQMAAASDQLHGQISSSLASTP